MLFLFDLFYIVCCCEALFASFKTNKTKKYVITQNTLISSMSTQHITRISALLKTLAGHFATDLPLKALIRT